MKSARVAFSTVVVLLLMGGYFASQRAFFQGSFSEYAKKVDTPQIAMLALVITVIAVIFAFLPDREDR